MRTPIVTSVAEVHELGEHRASVTLKVPIEDLDELLYHCDYSGVAGAGVEDALAASRRAAAAARPPVVHVGQESVQLEPAHESELEPAHEAESLPPVPEHAEVTQLMPASSAKAE